MTAIGPEPRGEGNLQPAHDLKIVLDAVSGTLRFRMGPAVPSSVEDDNGFRLYRDAHGHLVMVGLPGAIDTGRYRTGDVALLTVDVVRRAMTKKGAGQ